MLTRISWGLMLIGLLGAGGCRSTSDELTPLNNDQLKAFFSRAQDPRRFWITVYEAEEGANFAGACRLHPEQVARLKFESGSRSLIPVIPFKGRTMKSFQALIDTSSSFSWLTFNTAKALEVIPLGPPAYELTPQHVKEGIPGYACAINKIVFDQLHMETPLFYTRAALGPLGLLSRGQISPLPEAVIGCNLLKAFSFVQIDYATRYVTLVSTFDYAPGTNLIAVLPLQEIKGALAITGLLEGQEQPFLLDTAGDYELALKTAPAEPIRQLSFGDLVFRRIPAVSVDEKGLGRPDLPRLGSRLLGKFILTFDFKKRVVYFEKP